MNQISREQATMPSDKFCSALKKGLGRAMTLLSEAPDSPELNQALLHACLVNQVYDRQCEEDRVNYLYNLIVRTGKIEFYRSEIFGRLLEANLDSEQLDKVQMGGSLCRVAADGHDEDRHRLQNFLIEADYDDVASSCMDRYVWLEGVDGFLFCVKHFLESLTENFLENGWVFSSLLGTLKEHHGDEISMQVLEKARAGWPKLDELLRLHSASDSKKPSQLEADLSYAAAKTGYDPKRGFSRSWIIRAPFEELTLAAKDLLNESDERTVRHYLKIFGGRDFPLLPSELFRFVKSTDSRISYAAVKALTRLSHPDIRELALRTIAEGENPELAIRLLSSNFHSGDLRDVETLIDRLCLDEETWHSIGLALLNLLELASIFPEESRSLLLRLYEESPCSLCRGGFVEKLYSAGYVPDWMADEARFDADPATASLFTADKDTSREQAAASV